MNLTNINYSSNPLIKPLINFNSQITSSFSSLPSKGIVLEIAKRIALIVISPFAYLVLGFSALMGLVFNSSLQKKEVNNISDNSNSIAISDKSISIASVCDEMKKQIIITVNDTKNINEIDSAKILFDIECESKKFSKDHIIKPLVSSDFDQAFLSKILDTILTEAKDYFKTQNTDKLSYKWIAILKDKNGVFHAAHASEKKEKNSIGGGSGKSNGIKSKNLDKYFELVLKQYGREIKPQVDSQFNFI